MKTVSPLAVALVALSAAPALSRRRSGHPTDQLIVVTPNPPVIINNGPGTQAPGGAEERQPPPHAMARRRTSRGVRSRTSTARS